MWDNREIKPVFEIEQENNEAKTYKATRWYVANQLKKNKDIQYEASDVLEPASTEPKLELVAYMETVSSRMEVCYRDFQEREQNLTNRLLEARGKIATLEAELKDA